MPKEKASLMRERKYLWEPKTRCANEAHSRNQQINPPSSKVNAKDLRVTYRTGQEPNNSKPRHSQKPTKRSQTTSAKNTLKDITYASPSRRWPGDDPIQLNDLARGASQLETEIWKEEVKMFMKTKTTFASNLRKLYSPYLGTMQQDKANWTRIYDRIHQHCTSSQATQITQTDLICGAQLLDSWLNCSLLQC